jgi:hypothetical protein
MARFFVVDSGSTTRLAKKLFIVDSGNTTRQIKRMFVVDSGNVARLVFAAATVIPTSVSSSSTLPAAATSTIEFNTSGQEVAIDNANPTGIVIGNWLPGGGTSGYQIKATLSSGTAPQASGNTNTLGTWLPVTSALTWGLEQVTAGTIACSLLFQISTNSSNVLASGTISLSASASH